MASKKPPVRKPRFEFVEDIDPQSLVVDRFYDDAPLATGAPEPEKAGGFSRFARDVGVGALKSAVGLPEAFVGMADLATGGHAGRLAERAGVRFKDTQQILDTWYSPETQEAKRQFQEAEGIGGKFGAAVANPSVVGTTVLESLAQMGGGAGIARGIMSKAPSMSALMAGAIGEGAMGAGSSAEQIRQQTDDGLLSAKQAGLAALSGVGTAAFGAAGGKVAQRLGIGDVDTMLAQGSRQSAQAAVDKGVTRRFLEGAVSEGFLEELPQSLQEQVLQNAALDRPLDEGVDGAAVLGVLSGMAMGGPAGALSRGPEPAAAAAPPPIVPPSGPLSRAANAGAAVAPPAAPLALGYNGRTEDVLIPAEDGTLRVQTPDERDAIAAEKQRRIDLGLEELRTPKAVAPADESTIDAAPGDVREVDPDTGEIAPPAAAAPILGNSEDATRAPPAAHTPASAFASLDEADAYADAQMKRGASVIAAPVQEADGSITMVGKSDPRYQQAQADRTLRKKARAQAAKTKEPVNDPAGEAAQPGPADAGAVPGTERMGGQPADLGAMPGPDAPIAAGDVRNGGNAAGSGRGPGNDALSPPDQTAILPLDPPAAAGFKVGEQVETPDGVGVVEAFPSGRVRVNVNGKSKPYPRNAITKPEQEAGGAGVGASPQEAPASETGAPAGVDAAGPAGPGPVQGAGPAAVEASGVAPAAPVAEDAPEAAWTRATEADRYGILARAGWAATGDKPSTSAQRAARMPWAKLSESQRARIGAAASPGAPGQSADKVDTSPERVEKTQESEQVAQAAAKPAEPSLYGADIDGDWQQFSETSGTRGVPRAEMPQIKAEHRGAMTQFLAARGITHEQAEVPAGSLKPTQAEFSREKVKKAKTHEGGDRSILVSSDGHVLDGHHQWLAKREAGEPVKVIRLDAPIERLLTEVREFPSAEQAEGAAPDAPQQAAEAETPAQPEPEKPAPAPESEAPSLPPAAEPAPAPPAEEPVQASRPAPGKIEDVDETRADDEGKVAKFSRRSSGRGVTMRDAEAAVDLLRRELPSAPEIVLLDRVQDAPAELQATIRARGAENDVEAVYEGGVIYAFPGNFIDMDRFMFVVGRHEVRHAGFDAMLGQDKDAILMSIGRANRRVALEARKLMDDGFADSFAEGVEEALADMTAEDVAALSRIKLAVAAIRRWLRATAFKLRKAGWRALADAIEPRTWSDNDVIAFVKRAEDVSRGPGGNGGARFSRDADAAQGDGVAEEFERAAIAAGGEPAYARAFSEGRTVLTYRQWVQVRTERFKKWWGYDWERTNLRRAAQGVPGAAERGQAPGVDGRAARGFPFLHEGTQEPRVFFHGTRDAFTAFDIGHANKKDHGWLGVGHYVTSDEWIADTYSRAKRGSGKPQVMALFVRPNNPVELTPRKKELLARARPADVAVLTDEWRQKGHGGSMLVYEDGSIEVAVFDANGIKSASDNTGAFDPAKPDIRFSRDAEPNKQEARALAELSKHDDLFALKKSFSVLPQQIAKDIESGMVVQKVTPDPGKAEQYKITTPNGEVAWMYVRTPNPFGSTLYGFDMNEGEMVNVYEGRPGENPDDVDPDTQDVYIDASKLTGRGDGQFVYALAGAFAHNTGRIFIGDPAGLSDDALRRRPENMVSLALKYGTTKFLAPHPRQIVGAPSLGVPPLKWVYGDDVGNLHRLIALNTAAVENAFPDVRKIEFDLETGTFRNATTGQRVSMGLLRGRLHGRSDEVAGGAAGAAKAGSRTYARAVLWRALSKLADETSSGGGSGDGRPAGVLGALSDASRIHAKGELKGLFSRASRQRLPEWIASASPELQAAASKIDTYTPEKPITEKVKAMATGWKGKLVQGMLDAYAPLKDLSMDAYIAARMAKSADGAFEGMLMYGKPKIDQDGALTGDLDGKGFLGAMQELNGEHDRFFMWVAGQRARRLMGDDREHLFTAAEIAAMVKLNQGSLPDGSSRAAAYSKAQGTLAAYNKAVMDIAEKTGLVDGESRAAWEQDIYVPFYRVAEEQQMAGPGRVKGLVRQEAFKRLKGGKENLGDLMDNTLRNWSHLLSASLANQAAGKSLLAAEEAGVAIEAKEATAKDMAKTIGKKGGAVYFMDQGEQRWFTVADQAVLDAITSMEAVGLNGIPMKLMGQFKKWLTIGVTISPAFKVRNLIRDSLAAPAANPMSFNVLKNLTEGWSATGKDSKEYAQMLFGGALMRFGTNVEGDRASHVKRLIEAGVKDQTILDTKEKVRAAVMKAWDAWQDFGDRMENINRSALYKQLREQGKSHLEASFMARDMMDFSLQGSWAAIRILTQVVPFMNARLQGLYKLGRGASDDPKRFGYVVGAVALVSIALMLAYEDDDDWKRREDWDRDNFWWFKIGDTAFRIPKPFEVGALGTIAERSVELMVSDEMTGKRFASRIKEMLLSTFAMNPIPQAFKPMIDLYANKNSFTGRDIESLGMERFSKSERYGPNTSAFGRLIGSAGDFTGVSPVQVDHLIRAYLGWLGAMALTTTDVLSSPFAETPRPAFKLDDFTSGFAKELPEAQSRYVTEFYEQARKVSQVMADIKRAREMGDLEGAAEMLEDNRDEVATHRLLQTAQRRMAEINKQLMRIRMGGGLDPDAKRTRIDELTQQRNRLTEVIANRLQARRQALPEPQ